MIAPTLSQTNPPSSANPPLPISQPNDPIRATAPVGVGGVTSQLSPPPPAPQQKGYIVSAVLALTNFIKKIFSRLYNLFLSCGKREAAPPVQGERVEERPVVPPPPPVDPIIQGHRNTLQRLRTALRPEEVKRDFETYFPEESDRNEIYFQLGQAAPLSWGQSLLHGAVYTANYSRQQKIHIGKQMVERSPLLLLSYLIPKVEQLANPSSTRPL